VGSGSAQRSGERKRPEGKHSFLRGKLGGIAALRAAIKSRSPDFRQKKFGFCPKGTANLYTTSFPPRPASGGARQQSPKIRILKIGGVYLKISEPKLRTIGSAGGRAKTTPPFRPPRLEPERKGRFQVFLWRIFTAVLGSTSPVQLLLING